MVGIGNALSLLSVCLPVSESVCACVSVWICQSDVHRHLTFFSSNFYSVATHPDCSTSIYGLLFRSVDSVLAPSMFKVRFNRSQSKHSRLDFYCRPTLSTKFIYAERKSQFCQFSCAAFCLWRCRERAFMLRQPNDVVVVVPKVNVCVSVCECR